MLISVNKRLVFLSMPKCGSTAIEVALTPHFGGAFSGPPKLKHMPFSTFHDRLRPLLESYTGGRSFETVCLFREPMDWRRSWWRYRMRDAAKARGRSTQNMSFAEFLEANLSGEIGPAKTGNQARFVSDKSGAVAVDRVYRYDNIAECHAYLCKRLGVDAPLGRANVSSARPEEEALEPGLAERVREALAREYEIYRTVAI